MKRILHVLGGLSRGGAETMAMNLCRALDRSRMQFDFLVHTGERCGYADEITGLGGRIYSVPRYKGTNHLAYVRAWDSFLSRHPEYRILHSHVRSSASIYLPIAKKYGVKTIVHSHATSNGTGAASFVKGLLQYPLRYQADYFMGCSREAGEWLFGKGICRGGRYAVIPNAVDVGRFESAAPAREEYRRELGADGKFVYIHVGRFHEAKNHLFLLELYREITRRKADTALWLVGDGGLRPEIEAKIRELGLGGSVRLLGSRGDVPQLLQAADMFLFPSKWEGLPVAVVEAQAAGLKCVISDSVTAEADMTDLIRRCPLGDGIHRWAGAVLAHDGQDGNAGEKIREAGFDVRTACHKLMGIYGRLEAP